MAITAFELGCMLIKKADEHSYLARHVQKLVNRKDPAMLERLGHLVKGPKVELKDAIRKMLPRSYIGKETPGYVYRSTPGTAFTGNSGIEATRAGVHAKDVGSLLFAAPSAQDILLGNYHRNSGSTIKRFKLPEFLSSRVTPAEGDPRGFLYRPGLGAQSFSKYRPVSSHMGGANELVLDRHAVDKYLRGVPKRVVEELPKPGRVLGHDVIWGPAGEVLASNIPVSPKAYYAHPELR